MKACKSFCVVDVLYELAFIDGRLEADQRVSHQDEQWRSTMIELFPGDRDRGRRRHMRTKIMVPADLYHGPKVGRALLLDLSMGGICLSSSFDLSAGDRVLVKVGRRRTVQYSFPALVQRVVRLQGSNRIGLRLTGIPLKVQHGAQPPTPKTCQCLVPPGVREEHG